MDARERIKLSLLVERVSKEREVADRYGIINSSHMNNPVKGKKVDYKAVTIRAVNKY